MNVENIIVSQRPAFIHVFSITIKACGCQLVNIKEIVMVAFKKWIFFSTFFLAGFILVINILMIVEWPSKSKFCRLLERHITRSECIKLDNKVEIIDQAFPIGKATSSDVKAALGEYLYREATTTYGHLESYHLGIRPINYLFKNFDSYMFRYDSNGVLVAFSYDD